MSVTYLVGDTREQVATIPDGSVALVACSPPFIALRSYLPADHPLKHAEIGSEPDPATFLDTLLHLTAEWGRVLAPWGSIAIELGDTYSSLGGTTDNRETSNGGNDFAPRSRGGGQGWPRAKCLALVPQLYAASLAYGRNLLTGEPSPAGQWLVRNMIVWHRPNPAVGALGDKYRPSTSYITVATRSPKRWFDLTAVRGDFKAPDNNAANLKRGGPTYGIKGPNMDRGDLGAGNFYSKHAGAPPLDAWFDEHDTWTLTTQPSRVSIPIESRVPCGPDDGGERTTSPDCPVHGDRPALAPTEPHGEHAGSQSHHTEHTDDHPDQGPALADACGASTSTNPSRAANPHDTGLSRTAPALSTNQLDTPSARTDARTEHTSTSPESCAPDPDTHESSSGGVCPLVGEHETGSSSDHTSDSSAACTCTFHLVKTSIHSHYAMWPAKLAERLILSMCPQWVCSECGEPRRRVEKATYIPHGDVERQHAENRAQRGMAERGVNGTAQQFANGRATKVPQTLGWTSCGHDAYVPGTVLDPFCGTFTTGCVAEYHGRSAIGIDLDERNRDLWPLRREEVFRALNPTRVKPLEGQLDMFGGVA